MDQQLKDFVYHNNGWSQSPVIKKKEKDLRGNVHGKLLYNNIEISRGTFPYLQKEKTRLLRSGYRKELFKLTY